MARHYEAGPPQKTNKLVVSGTAELRPGVVAAMIRKVYETDPLICPNCQGQMSIIAFITDYPVVDRIINHLKLTFVADKPPPPHIASQEVLMAAAAGGEYLS